MKFNEISAKVQSYQHLIGKTIHNAVIDEIVPVPIGYEEAFWKYYVDMPTAEYALATLIHNSGIFPLDMNYQLYAVCDKNQYIQKAF